MVLSLHTFLEAAATATMKDDGDVDSIIRFPDGIHYATYSNNYFGLADTLEFCYKKMWSLLQKKHSEILFSCKALISTNCNYYDRYISCSVYFFHTPAPSFLFYFLSFTKIVTKRNTYRSNPEILVKIIYLSANIGGP